MTAPFVHDPPKGHPKLTHSLLKEHEKFSSLHEEPIQLIALSFLTWKDLVKENKQYFPNTYLDDEVGTLLGYPIMISPSLSYGHFVFLLTNPI
jgi:hypothetical protein